MDTSMRRKERQVTDINEIAEILSRCDVIHVGINGDDGFPYVIPVNFGYDISDGKIIIYFHGAKAGYKYQLIQKNKNVCVEADIFHRYATTGSGDATAEYESVIGYGTAELVTGEELGYGLTLLLEHCGFAGHFEDCMRTGAVALYKITLETVSGKKNLLGD